MMETHEYLLAAMGLYDKVSGLLVAFIGAAAFYFHQIIDAGHRFAWIKFIGTTFIGGFVGVMMHYLAISQWPPDSSIVVFITGSSGAVGYKIFDKALEAFIDRFIGKMVDRATK